MNVDQKNFIEELRSLSEPVKRKILFCAAIASMIIVTGLWMAYFNTIVPNAVPAAAQAVATTVEPNTSGPGFLGIFADAAGSFWGAALNGARGVIGALKNPKQYNIGPK
jgi:hypothetical protein